MYLSWNCIAFFQCTLLASHKVTDGKGIFDTGKLLVSITDTVGLVVNLCQLMADRYILPDAAMVHSKLQRTLKEKK
jgi:hypothetical protein